MKFVTLVASLLLVACGGAEPGPPVATVPSPPTIDIEALSAELRAAVARAEDAVRQTPASPEAWLALGQLLHAHELVEAAHRCYDEVLQLDDDRPRAHYLRALIDEKRGAHEPAIAGFLRTDAISRERGGVGYAPAQLHVGLVQVQLARTDEALETLARMIDEFPKFEEGRLEYASLLLQEGRAEEALTQLELVDAAAPNDLRVVGALARAHQLLGHGELAQSLAQRSRSLDSTVPRRDKLRAELSALVLGETRRLESATADLAAGRFEPALDEARSLLAQRPDDVQVLMLQGKAEAGLGQHYQALETFLRVAELRRDLDEPILLAAHSAIEVGQVGQALGLVRGVLARGESSVARSLLGRALLLSGQTEAADVEYRTLHEQHKGLPVNDWMMWGLVAIERAQPAEAAERFQAALAVVPDFAAAHLHLSIALEALQRPEEALAAYDRAHELDPGLPNVPGIEALRPAVQR